MQKTHARLTILMDTDRKKAFDLLCKRLGTTSSETVRRLIQDYLDGKRPLKNVLENGTNTKPSPDVGRTD